MTIHLFMFLCCLFTLILTLLCQLSLILFYEAVFKRANTVLLNHSFLDKYCNPCLDKFYRLFESSYNLSLSIEIWSEVLSQSETHLYNFNAFQIYNCAVVFVWLQRCMFGYISFPVHLRISLHHGWPPLNQKI